MGSSRAIHPPIETGGFLANLCKEQARLDFASRGLLLARVEQLREMSLGIFTSACVVHLQLGRKVDAAHASGLLVCSLDELKTIAAEKGGTRVLLDD